MTITERSVTIIDRLAAFQVDRANLTDLIVMIAEAEPVKKKFEDLDIQVPEVLSEGLRTLNREAKRRADDSIEMRLRELEQADAADRSSAERRQDRENERRRLLAKRAGETPTPQPTPTPA